MHSVATSATIRWRLGLLFQKRNSFNTKKKSGVAEEKRRVQPNNTPRNQKEQRSDPTRGQAEAEAEAEPKARPSDRNGRAIPAVQRNYPQYMSREKARLALAAASPQHSG